MGYETKYYAVKRYDFKSFINKGYNASEIVAMIDMCKMGYDKDITEFYNLFTEEADFVLYMEDYNEEIDKDVMTDVTEDRYGRELCYIPRDKIGRAIEIFENKVKVDNYWRYELLLNFFKTFEKYEDIYIVLYGY